MKQSTPFAGLVLFGIVQRIDVREKDGRTRQARPSLLLLGTSNFSCQQLTNTASGKTLRPARTCAKVPASAGRDSRCCLLLVHEDSVIAHQKDRTVCPWSCHGVNKHAEGRVEGQKEFGSALLLGPVNCLERTDGRRRHMKCAAADVIFGKEICGPYHANPRTNQI
jgi:hypothetical protein